MRYIRIQLDEKGHFRKYIFCMLMIIFILTILLALLIENNNLLTAKDLKKQEDIKLDTNQKINFYYVQLGYFNEEKNAEGFVKSLNVRKIYATYVNINGKYHVISWIDNIKEDIKIYEKYLINLNTSYIIKNVELSINNKKDVELIKTIIKQIGLLKGKVQQEQLSIDNIYDNKDEKTKKFYNEYMLFINNYKNGDINSCLKNLANEIFIIKNFH